MNNDKSIEALRQRITMLGALGMPFYIAFALGSASHFKGIAFIPALETPSTAFNVMLVGAIGALINMALTLHTVYRIKQIENSKK